MAEVPEDEYGAKDYRSQMELKPDHASRPIWVVSEKYDIMNRGRSLCSKSFCYSS